LGSIDSAPPTWPPASVDANDPDATVIGPDPDRHSGLDASGAHQPKVIFALSQHRVLAYDFGQSAPSRGSSCLGQRRSSLVKNSPVAWSRVFTDLERSSLASAADLPLINPPGRS
jgi:hypothetical protein